MESPIRAEADLTKSVESWVTLIPDGVRAVGNRLTEMFDYNRDQRRARNAAAIVAASIPLMNDDAQSPDEDWLSEFFDLAGKRSVHDWQTMLSKTLARESNGPGSVPQRYIVDMARLDKEVLDEFIYYCGWYVPPLGIVKTGTSIPTLCSAANLIHHGGGYTKTTPLPLSNQTHGRISINDSTGTTNFMLPYGTPVSVGSYLMTPFGQFLWGLFDPKPALAPDLRDQLIELWKDYLEKQK